MKISKRDFVGHKNRINEGELPSDGTRKDPLIVAHSSSSPHKQRELLDRFTS